MHTPTIGTISHGTLRTEDLLAAFANELRMIEPNASLVAEADAVALLHSFGWLDIMIGQGAGELVDDLIEALNALAPAYCYFGTTEGDGSDFGFWPDMEAIDELPRVADPADVPAGGTGEDVVYVNDHGNVTVYGANGAVLLDIV
jgi:hypothetical protein